MKRLILPLLLLLAIGMLVAAESPASDVVGYFKIAVPQNEWTPVSIPFQITDDTPGAIFGDNWNSTPEYENPDFIFDAYSGRTTSYWFEFGWDFEPEDEDDLFGQPGHVYWINRLQPASDESLILMGKVNPQPISLTMNGQSAGGWTTFAHNDAKPVSPEIMGFQLTDPDFDNGIFDMIVCTDGTSATYIGEFEGEYWGWLDNEGNPYFINPTLAYYYNSNQAENWSWEYPAVPGRFNNNSNKSLIRRK